jgi:hypothetical protein
VAGRAPQVLRARPVGGAAWSAPGAARMRGTAPFAGAMAASRWNGPAGASRGRWIASEPIRLSRHRQAGTRARQARSVGACVYGRICIRVVAAAIIGRSLAGWGAHRMRARPNARLRTSRARGRIMITYSVSQAAAAVGRDRSSIRRESRAVRSRRCATRRAGNGASIWPSCTASIRPRTPQAPTGAMPHHAPPMWTHASL